MITSLSQEWNRRADASGDGQFAIAAALLEVARAIDRLGNADAATPMGAIEMFGKHIGEKLDDLTSAISDITRQEP